LGAVAHELWHSKSLSDASALVHDSFVVLSAAMARSNQPSPLKSPGVSGTGVAPRDPEKLDGKKKFFWRTPGPFAAFLADDP
jgi:hypothetical protein